MKATDHISEHITAALGIITIVSVWWLVLSA